MWCPAYSGSIVSPRLQAAWVTLAAAVWATIFHRDYENPPLMLWAACRGCTRCRGPMLNYLTLSKMGFCTHPLPSVCTWKQILLVSFQSPVAVLWSTLCEHWAYLASVFLYLDSGTSCPDYPAAEFWEHLPELSWCFEVEVLSMNTTVEGLPLGVHLFTCIILISVILLASEEYLWFYG